MFSNFEPDVLIQTLSGAIRRRRKELNISQEDLSYDAGFARSYLSDVERGSRSFSIKNFVRIANCLAIRPSHLMLMAEESMANKAAENSISFCEDLGLIATWLNDSSFGLLITDPQKPDNPIVYVSPGFADFTGYRQDEILGKNCRFLQGTDTHQPALKELKAALETGVEHSIQIRNYKKDGSAFLNSLSIHPLMGRGNQVVNFVGLQRFCDRESQTQGTESTASSERHCELTDGEQSNRKAL